VGRLHGVFGDMDFLGGDDDATDVLIGIATDVKGGRDILTELQFDDGRLQADPMLEHRHVLARRDLRHAEDAIVGLPLPVGYLPRFAESGTEVRRHDHGWIILDEERSGGAADQEEAEEERGEEAGHECVEGVEFGVWSIGVVTSRPGAGSVLRASWLIFGAQ
jgi:hypothetical protein